RQIKHSPALKNLIRGLCGCFAADRPTQAAFDIGISAPHFAKSAYRFQEIPWGCFAPGIGINTGIKRIFKTQEGAIDKERINVGRGTLEPDHRAAFKALRNSPGTRGLRGDRRRTANLLGECRIIAKDEAKARSRQ